MEPMTELAVSSFKVAKNYVISHLSTLLMGVMIVAGGAAYYGLHIISTIKSNSYEFCKTINAKKNCIECHRGENFLTIFRHPSVENNPKLRKDILNQSGVR
jgi:hypothetical protein